MNIPSQITFNPVAPDITVNWDAYDWNKPRKKKCGHEVPAVECIIKISSPGDELTAAERFLIDQQMDDLCNDCYQEWSKHFWAAKTGILNEEYKLTFKMELHSPILRGFPPSNTISPTIVIRPQDLGSIYPYMP